MVVQHNITAMNSNRMLGLTTSAQAKSTEKLSSGYKINRAADDAAGLSISEKMRRQIRGLTQASANAQDGISCVQTAEGALNEVQDMLQRMNELAVKGENGTLTSTDRSYIQSEVQQMMSEIDRVQSTTTFNEQNLLDGSFKNKGLQVGAESGQHISITIKNMKTNELIANAVADGVKFGVSNTEKDSTNSTDSSNYADNNLDADGKKTFASNLLSKFYAFDPDDVKDADIKDKVDNLDNKGATTETKSKLTDAPTAADFAALNAFAKHAIKDVSQQRSDLGAIQNRLSIPSATWTISLRILRRQRLRSVIRISRQRWSDTRTTISYSRLVRPCCPRRTRAISWHCPYLADKRGFRYDSRLIYREVFFVSGARRKSQKIRVGDFREIDKFGKRVVYKTTLLLYDDLGKRFLENLFQSNIIVFRTEEAWYRSKMSQSRREWQSPQYPRY